jgi:hypothetical protein
MLSDGVTLFKDNYRNVNILLHLSILLKFDYLIFYLTPCPSPYKGEGKFWGVFFF